MNIDNTEVMTHTLSILPESYERVVEYVEGKLDYNNDYLTTKNIHEKLLNKLHDPAQDSPFDFIL